MSDLARQLGKRIYLFRKENGLTQAALAEKAKISNEFMSGIERGTKLPSILTLEKLAAALRVNPKDLFNFDEAGYRRTLQLSRNGMDIALLLENTPAQLRRRSPPQPSATRAARRGSTAARSACECGERRSFVSSGAYSFMRKHPPRAFALPPPLAPE